MEHRSIRSPLARAIGLGSAKSGVEHWWAQRVSAVALVPLTLWFVASLIAHSRSGYNDIVLWLRNPAAAIAMILLVLFLFHHAALGLQVVIEDYIHSGAKYAALISVRLCCLALAIAGTVAVLEIGMAR